MSDIETIKLYSLTASSSVLIVIYSSTLYRVLKGSRFTLVIRLITLLMLYNISVIVHQRSLKVLQRMLRD